jgi:hypothetical protein
MCIRDMLLKYLKEQTKERRLRYFKAKWIGAELGLSAKQVGSNLVILKDETTELRIVQYSCGVGCTTWRVEAI